MKFKSAFTDFLFNEALFANKEKERILHISKSLPIEELKKNFFFYYSLYEKSEGNLLCKSNEWTLLKNDMIKNYSSIQLWEIENYYKSKNKIEFSKSKYMDSDMYNYYLSTSDMFDSMDIKTQATSIYNFFILAILMDTVLTDRDELWHPYTEYGMVLHYEYLSSNKVHASN